jgi:hypothetical protein
VDRQTLVLPAKVTRLTTLLGGSAGLVLCRFRGKVQRLAASRDAELSRSTVLLAKSLAAVEGVSSDEHLAAPTLLT